MRLGADPDQLLRLARTFDRAAATAARIGRDVHRATETLWWAGSDRVEFDRQRRALDQVCHAVGAPLRTAAAELVRQAEEQERSSTGAGSPDRDRAPEPQVMWLDRVGDGREIVAFGDPATARHLAVLVPGIGTTVRNFDATMTHARDLWSAIAHDHPDAAADGVAVIAWLGYDAPGGFREPERFGEMLTDAAAEEGATSLRRFLRHLRRRDDASLTLIGHSYGSIVVAKAASHGRTPDADRLVVLGSPGVGVNRATELGLDPGTVLYAAAAPGDPVSHTQWFGTDPTLPGFGAEVISAEGIPGAPPPPISTVHSSYFTPGSDALRQLATVVIGAHPTPAEPTPLEGLVDPVFEAVGLPYLPEPLRRPTFSVAGMLGDELLRASGQRSPK